MCFNCVNLEMVFVYCVCVCDSIFFRLQNVDHAIFCVFFMSVSFAGFFFLLTVMLLDSFSSFFYAVYAFFGVVLGVESHFFEGLICIPAGHQRLAGRCCWVARTPPLATSRW